MFVEVLVFARDTEELDTAENLGLNSPEPFTIPCVFDLDEVLSYVETFNEVKDGITGVSLKNGESMHIDMLFEDFNQMFQKVRGIKIIPYYNK